MIDFLYSLNQKLSNNPRFFEKVRINSMCRFLVRVTANNVLPHYLKHTKNKYEKYRGVEVVPVVVSLTSFPARIGKLWMVIEAMLRQRTRPERIVLWLSRCQFPDEYVGLPQQLIEQQSRGLEIRFVDGDIRSHKKYYYSFSEFKGNYVLTIDDDLLFPSTFVKEVYDCAQRHPNCVIANFGSRIFWDEKAHYLGRTDCKIKPEESGNDLFFGSGGGTLFQPSKLEKYIDDISVVWNLCPTADDIYLNAITRLAGQAVTFMRVSPLLSLTNDGDEKLTDYNGNLYDPNSKNADQLRALVEYMKAKWGRNPFDVNLGMSGGA